MVLAPACVSRRHLIAEADITEQTTATSIFDEVLVAFFFPSWENYLADLCYALRDTTCLGFHPLDHSQIR